MYFALEEVFGTAAANLIAVNGHANKPECVQPPPVPRQLQSVDSEMVCDDE